MIREDRSPSGNMIDGIYSTFRIQPEGTQMCGQLCLYVLYKLHQEDNFYDTILELNDYFNNKV